MTFGGCRRVLVTAHRVRASRSAACRCGSRPGGRARTRRRDVIAGLVIEFVVVGGDAQGVVRETPAFQESGGAFGCTGCRGSHQLLHGSGRRGTTSGGEQVPAPCGRGPAVDAGTDNLAPPRWRCGDRAARVPGRPYLSPPPSASSSSVVRLCCPMHPMAWPRVPSPFHLAAGLATCGARKGSKPPAWPRPASPRRGPFPRLRRYARGDRLLVSLTLSCRRKVWS